MPSGESSPTGETSERSILSCSVVICTRDRPEQLEQCLEAVSRLNYPQVDVLVVDSAPSQDEARLVAARWGARYLAEPIIGASRARNRGARACGTEVVAFLDDDSIPEPGWLSAVAREFLDPEVMAVSGRVFPVQVETEAEHLFERVGGFDVGGQRWELDRRHPLWFELGNFCLGNETNIAFRRLVFDVLPGFSERLGRGTGMVEGCEGSYLLFSLLHRGYRVIYTPEAVVRHPFPRTIPQLRARWMTDCSAATAYMTLLFVEEPRYRWAVTRYMIGALRGKRRAWRPPLPGTQPYPRIIPRWRALLAYFSGPFLYAGSCFRQRAKASYSPVQK
jgi:glycosyltransferase involved in cell wall biosynthesis